MASDLPGLLMHRLRLPTVLAMWAVILTVISLRVVLAARNHSVYPIFSDAGRKWLAGADLYGPPTEDLDQFRYAPAVAAGFAPWGLLPDRIGEVLWRWLNAGVFFGALAVWGRWWWSRPNLPAVLLLVLPLTVGGLNNGQCNALLTGLTLLATVAFARGHLWAAAAAITVTTLFKGYPLALGMLFCLVEPRRFTPRLAAFVLAGFALPYLMERPDYVTRQYAAFVERVGADDRSGWPVFAGYRDLHMLLRLTGWEAPLAAYRGIEVLAGLACAAVVVAGRWRVWDRRRAVAACLSLGACWMTLCGPATESCTYVLITPVLAQAVLDVAGRSPWRRGLVFVSFGLFTLSALIVWFPGWIAHPVQASGVQPLAACLLMAHVLGDCWRELRAEVRVKGTRLQNEVAGLTSAGIHFLRP